MLYNRAKFLQSTSNDERKKNQNIFMKNHNKNNNQNQLTQQQLKIFKLREQIVKDISHPRIRQLINSHKSPQQLISRRHFQQKKQQSHNNLTNLQLLQQRKWLNKKGKKYLIDFDDNQRKQMKFCFNAMDIKQQGSIGIDQLQQLLISVGLMESRQQVKQLIDSVDQDKSGKIQFAQFLKMILNDQGENQQIVQFFKTIINQNIQKSARNNRNNQQTVKKLKISKADKLHKKISLIADKENNHSLAINQRISTKQSRITVNKPYQMNKCFSEMQKNKNSALKIFQKHPHPKNLPFGMVVSHIRRKHMMTALRISSPQNMSNKIQNRSDHFMRSSQNIKQVCKLNTTICDEQDVNKGQNVMNALKRMWDRRLLRQIRQNKKNQKIQQLKKTNFQFPM